MHNIDELFWSSTVEEMTRGYKETQEGFTCLLCGECFEAGRVYPMDDAFFDAKRAVGAHIVRSHGSVFDHLLNLGKRFTGLSDVQRTVVEMLYMNRSDDDIAKALGGRARSTVRNHRFALRERKQRAKVFLAIMANLEEREKGTNITIHKGATMIDHRFDITEKERATVIKHFIKDGYLQELPSKEKKKLIVLQELFKRFERGRDYTEREVNEVIKTFYHDFATLRRYLIEYGYLDRENDCSRYWVK